MSRGVKVLWIIIGSLFAVGIVLAVMGFALGGSGSAWVDKDGLHFGSQDTQVHEISDLSSEAFENIDVGLNSADVELVSGSSYGYEFTYTGTQKPSVEVSNGTLRVVEKEDGWRASIFNLWDWQRQQSKLIIYVPSDAVLDTVNLFTASGDTFLGGHSTVIKTLTVQSASGSVNLGAMNLEQLNLDVASGDVYIDTVTAQNAALNIVSGLLNYNGGSINNLVLDMASGDVWFKGAVSNSLVLRMVSGDADFKLAGSEDDYSFSVKRISGDIRVNGREMVDSALPSSTEFGNSSAVGRIELDTTSGSVNITFSNE